jgi:head-tail adaptor
MSSSTSLTPAQEREVAELEARIRVIMDKEANALARLLVSKKDHELFGATEFEVRDRVLRIGAQAYEEHLRGKKTAMQDPA